MIDPDAVWPHDGPSLCSETFKSQEGPTLSNDIWSKFDLLLTPPRTPLRDTDLDLGTLPEDLNFSCIELPLLEGDDLEVDLDSIDLDIQLPPDFTSILPVDFSSGVVCSHGLTHDTCASCEKLALAGSELRHDCMWVGTCTAEAHAHQHRTHSDSTCSHFSDLLMDSQRSFEAVANFTRLDDFQDDEDEDDSDAAQLDDDDTLAYNHMPRPDTPSESSETDTEDENEIDHISDHNVGLEEEIYTSGSPASTGMVHVDHTYHLPSTSSNSKSRPHIKSSSLLNTPSDTEEDEIDVVSVGASSSDNAYSCNTRSSKRSASSNNRNTTSKKSKRDVILSCSSDGSKKIFRIHTSLPQSPSSKTRKHLQEVVAEGVKHKARRGGGRASSLHKTPKRLHQRGSGGFRKRTTQRPDSDDPEKREMHNSLERMRRVDLRNAFEDLRVLIPDLEEKEKAPKVEILKKASYYCQQITKEEQRLETQLEKEKKYNLNLLKRLHALQRQAR